MEDDDILDVVAGGGHALFAPSSAHRWAYCHASVKFCEGLLDNTSVYAAEGTVAHKLVEFVRAGEGHRLVGTTQHIEGFDIAVSPEMLEHVEAYIAFADQEEGWRQVEYRVYFSDYMPIPYQGGTVDDLCLRPFVLSITDLKYGNIKVFAEGNLQLRLYALGAFVEFDAIYGFERIVMRIGQPRLGHWDRWEITRDELLAFGEWIREQAAACLAPNPVFAPSTSACRFCRAKTTCPARVEMLDRLGDDGFSALVTQTAAAGAVARLEAPPVRGHLPPPQSLSTAHLARVVAHRRGMETWLKAVYDELRVRALAGEAVPGFKLGAGRSTRAWREGAAVEEILSAMGVPRKEILSQSLVSPAAIDRAIAALPKAKRPAIRGVVRALVTKTPGRPSLVPEQDEEDEYESPAEQFEGGTYDPV